MTAMDDLEEKLARKSISYIATLRDGRQFFVQLERLIKSQSDWIVCQEDTDFDTRGDLPPALIRKSEIVSFTYLYQNGHEIYGEEDDDLRALFELFVQGVEE